MRPVTPARLKDWVRLRRSGAGAQVLVEGARAVGELLASSRPVEALVVDAARAFHPDIASLLAAAPEAIPRWSADATQIARLGATAHPPPVLAWAVLEAAPVERIAAASTLVVLDGIGDPGNAGTLLRCARAFGLGGVIFAGSGCAPTNDKLIRASAGAVFHLEWAIAPPPTATLGRTLAGRGTAVLAAAPRGGLEPGLAARRAGPRWALWLGGEARGPTDVPPAAIPVTIAMPGGAESLNVAIAGAILMNALVSATPPATSPSPKPSP